jgi:hypothetical protein
MLAGDLLPKNTPGNLTILLYARKSEQPIEIVEALNNMIVYMID